MHFPEYSEKYDLIGPAHIFELNIEGEGFRARKCFEGDIFSLPMYDEVFRRAAEKEDERTLCRMAALRLCRPISLSEGNRDVYHTYLLSHMEAFLDELIRQVEAWPFSDEIKEKVLYSNAAKFFGIEK